MSTPTFRRTAAVLLGLGRVLQGVPSYASASEVSDALGRLCGLESSAVLVASSGLLPPLAVALSRAGTLYVFAPGIQSLTQAIAIDTAWRSPAVFAPLRVVNAAIAIYRDRLFDIVLPYLSHATLKPASVCLVGHSFGGAAVQAVLALPSQLTSSVQFSAVSFGAPKWQTRLPGGVAGPSVLFSARGDYVPLLPPLLSSWGSLAVLNDAYTVNAYAQWLFSPDQLLLSETGGDPSVLADEGPAGSSFGSVALALSQFALSGFTPHLLPNYLRLLAIAAGPLDMTFQGQGGTLSGPETELNPPGLSGDASTILGHLRPGYTTFSTGDDMGPRIGDLSEPVINAGGGGYIVSLMGQRVAVAYTLANARSLRHYLRKFLLRSQASLGVSPTGLAAGLSAHLAVALNASSGPPAGYTPTPATDPSTSPV